jgi:tellurite resistance protein TerC
MVHRFHHLKYALAGVLIFIGSKIFLADLLGLEKFPPVLSLAITFGLLAGGVAWSLIRTAKTPAAASASLTKTAS